MHNTCAIYGRRTPVEVTSESWQSEPLQISIPEHVPMAMGNTGPGTSKMEKPERAGPKISEAKHGASKVGDVGQGSVKKTKRGRRDVKRAEPVLRPPTARDMPRGSALLEQKPHT